MGDADRVLIIDNEENIRTALKEALEEENLVIDSAENGETGIKKIETAPAPYNVIITDLKMKGVDGLKVLEFSKDHSPLSDVVLITAYGTIETAVKALKLGAYDYLTKPLDLIHFRNVVKKILEKQNLLRENVELKQILDIKSGDGLVVGSSKKIREVYDIVDQVADTDVTVLIEGESGTGKDVVAKTIHRRSSRHDKPFIIVNCGALPETLLENELFGHEKEAFTGATGIKKGRFELADGGTLFLDEVSEMGKNSQIDFLRVLEDGVIQRIGGTTPLKVDVRVIAASNKPLTELCEQDLFREDLYYRLNVVSINMPYLRERKEDIPILVEAFLTEFGIKHKKTDIQVSEETMKLLTDYPWPGNVRELKNCLERAVILGKGNEILAKHFPPSLQEFYFPKHKIEIEVGASLSEIEQEVISKTLKAFNGHRRKTAEILGISLRSLQYKIKEYNLEV